MKISTRTRYGTRLMTVLALEYEKGPVFLKDIARKEKISEKYLSQIIIPLRANGLVNSFRGAHGGYVLSMPPSQITVKDIVEVLEGGLTLVDCIQDVDICNHTSRCVTREVWEKLSANIADTLGSISLQDLVERYSEKSGKRVVMYNI
jgi:Rrf2 family protein